MFEENRNGTLLEKFHFLDKIGLKPSAITEISTCGDPLTHIRSVWAYLLRYSTGPPPTMGWNSFWSSVYFSDIYSLIIYEYSTYYENKDNSFVKKCALRKQFQKRVSPIV